MLGEVNYKSNKKDVSLVMNYILFLCENAFVTTFFMGRVFAAPLYFTHILIHSSTAKV